MADGVSHTIPLSGEIILPQIRFASVSFYGSLNEWSLIFPFVKRMYISATNNHESRDSPMFILKDYKGSFSCNQIVLHSTEPLIHQFGTTDIISTIEDLLLNVYRYRHCNYKLGNMYSKIKHEPSFNMKHMLYVIAERDEDYVCYETHK